MKHWVWVILAAAALGGCNPEDRSDLGQDASRLGQTATRSLSNAQLAARVTGSLSQTKGVDLSRLKVDAKNGVITLRGTIRTSEERRKILEHVREIRGVEQVVDETRVDR